MLLTIEKLIYGGDGLARLPAESSADPPARESQRNNSKIRKDQSRGKAIFVPFTLEGESVEASHFEQKPGFARAQLEDVVDPSPQRAIPRCPYFQRCGGCHYQHTNYENQLAIKSAILKETLRRQGKLELTDEIVAHSAEPWHYRNRSRFQVRTAPEFCAGYFRFASHDVLAVEECPISSPLVNRGLAALWELGRSRQIPDDLRAVEFFANADDSRLLAELWFAEATNDSAEAASRRITLGEKLTSLLRDRLPNLTSSYVFPQTSGRGPKAPVEPTPDWALGGGESRYQVTDTELRVSGGSFFQINRFLIDALVEVVTGGHRGALGIDLYAGVGLFTAALAKSYHHILAVESSHSSAADLKYNSPANVKVVRATVEEFLTKPPRHGKPDFVVVDPPRAGLGERVARSLVRQDAPRIAYVSCDPTTLARDLVHLCAAGYRIEQVHLIDLFPQTFHLETVVHLAR